MYFTKEFFDKISRIESADYTTATLEQKYTKITLVLKERNWFGREKKISYKFQWDKIYSSMWSYSYHMSSAQRSFIESMNRAAKGLE